MGFASQAPTTVWDPDARTWAQAQALDSNAGVRADPRRAPSPRPLASASSPSNASSRGQALDQGQGVSTVPAAVQATHRLLQVGWWGSSSRVKGGQGCFAWIWGALAVLSACPER